MKSKALFFFQQVYQIVQEIPYGYVMSYGQIASLLGHPRGARTVGWAMHSCPCGVPWHRVVRCSGEIPLSNRFEPENDQRFLLESEGITLLPSGRVDMNKHQVIFVDRMPGR